MKLMLSVMFLMNLSCAHHEKIVTVPKAEIVVYRDEKAGGNIQGELSISENSDQICFQISLKLNGVKENQAYIDNWVLAWMDADERYFLLPIQSRYPSSLPQGNVEISSIGHNERWKQEFVTCGPKEKFTGVQSIILTPKSSPYGIKELKFNLVE